MMFRIKARVDRRKENLPFFNEMMISWNGKRPVAGAYSIFVRVQIDEWSPWLLYGLWGVGDQSSFESQEGDVKIYQDSLAILGGRKATGFEIKVEPEAALRLHVYTNSNQESASCLLDKSIYLKVDGLSQIALNHPRHLDLCSPTATSAVIRYLKKQVDPVLFATCVWDRGFDLFGNWVLNVAEASALLGPSWDVWVERLDNFSEIYHRLHLKVPVIVSVRGPLPGSAKPYAQGHLLVVTGFDPEQKKVHCMDPAFPTDKETHVQYRLDDFLAAWERRGKIAYIFQKVGV